jgi:hypothetical protein
MRTDREEVKGEVVRTAWPERLPVGTRIVATTPRPEKIKFKGSMWFVREDGKLLFDEETDGKFRLLSGEFKLD